MPHVEKGKTVMTELTGMMPEELAAYVIAQGWPAYRAGQIFTWIHRGADFSDMLNLPKNIRETLAGSAIAQPVRILTSRVSKTDGTVKFLFGLTDGNCVEGVLMRYRYGVSLCISTQVGCKMGCAFCASTLDGCVRNLTAGEMLGEILCANGYLRDEKVSVSHVVLMGSGEPFDNYGMVMRFLRLLRDEDGLRMSLRNVSLSTCGLVPEMRRFADEGLPVTLSVSLHAPNDSLRSKLMPIAKRYPVADVIEAARWYIRRTGRRVIFEYALIKDVNSGIEHAHELAGLLRGMQCHVNLIPLNTVPERGLQGADDASVRAFLETLEKDHISATRRRELGDDIEGACGQLRRNIIQGEKEHAEV